MFLVPQFYPVYSLLHAPVAQWIEHQLAELGVGGSSPLGRATFSEIRES